MFQGASAMGSHAESPATTSMGESHNPAYYTAPNIPSSISCEISSKLTKEQQEILESEYGKQRKPSKVVKKGFAEQFGVSLDKINNWFQNRRAKSKQDAKKAAGSINLFNTQGQPRQVSYGSDLELSPAFSAPNYVSLMQQCTTDNQISNGLGIDMQQLQDSRYYRNTQYSASNCAEQYSNYHGSQQVPQDMFDSPQDLNRRTLTQEQFDAAFAQQGGLLDGNFDFMQSNFNTHHVDPDEYFPDFQGTGMKQQAGFDLAYEIPPPMSSHDSTIPSTISDQSANTFLSSSSIQDHASISATSSESADSRSSSVSALDQGEESSAHIPSHQRPAVATTSQWQPGQSKPVDFHALNQEFQQAAQARRIQESPQICAQPFVWPPEDAYARPDSQTSAMLAQSMNNVGINTPQPHQQATFKALAPALNIAARRQRPRPAALGLDAMCSQSYSGIVQRGPASQGETYTITPGQPALRRIRSTNVMNGIAQGRVHKSMPGSAPRSPLAFSFAEAVNSPKAMRHVSHQYAGNLAPPTPLSPNEFPRQEHALQHPGLHAFGHVSRQPNISETDLEHQGGQPYVPATSAPPQRFSSPPHTPMYHHQNYVQPRIGSNIFIENTPPQSAPASQQCFATNPFSMSMSHPQMAQPPAQQMQTLVQPPQQQFMDVTIPEPQFQVLATSMAQAQHMMAPTTSPPSGFHMQYHNIPVVNAQTGHLEVVPPQFMQQLQAQAHAQAPPPQTQQPRQMHMILQGGQYSTCSIAPPPQPMQVAAPVPKQQPQPTELFVHEYSPPAELKRAATPRTTVDAGPKNYTFANSTSNDYAEKRRKAKAKTAASAFKTTSPASSAGAGSSSS